MIAELLSLTGMVPLLPLLAASVIAAAPAAIPGAWIIIASSTLAFALACHLPFAFGAGELLLIDPLSAHMTMLTAFVGMTTAWFSRGYIAVEAAAGRLDAPRAKLYHALFLTFLGFMLLALMSNNLGVTWVSMEAATISAVLVVGLPRTADAVEASWKFFILCGVGIALALFGTIVLYLAALPALGPGLPAMSWNALARAAPSAHGPLLNLAFVFLLLGYGTKAGLAPLHAWMPDAHAEGPTPVSAVLAGSILNVALTIILRLRGLLAANHDAIAPGPPIMALGLFSLLLAAFSLWRRGDVKRFFAFSTIEQSGVVAFAFGLGGAGAVFAGVLHLTLHTLAKAAIFQCVGRATQLKGGQRFTQISGLARGHTLLAMTLGAGIIAVAGLPPFGLFASEFLIATETVRRLPWLAVPLGLGLIVGAWALASRLITLCVGPATEDPGPPVSALVLAPAWLHLALVLILGLAMPTAIVAWFTSIAAGAS
jgi:hydrogenase-4 component F